MQSFSLYDLSPQTRCLIAEKLASHWQLVCAHIGIIPEKVIIRVPGGTCSEQIQQSNAFVGMLCDLDYNVEYLISACTSSNLKGIGEFIEKAVAKETELYKCKTQTKVMEDNAETQKLRILELQKQKKAENEFLASKQSEMMMLKQTNDLTANLKIIGHRLLVMTIDHEELYDILKDHPESWFSIALHARVNPKHLAYTASNDLNNMRQVLLALPKDMKVSDMYYCLVKYDQDLADSFLARAFMLFDGVQNRHACDKCTKEVAERACSFNCGHKTCMECGISSILEYKCSICKVDLTYVVFETFNRLGF